MSLTSKRCLAVCSEPSMMWENIAVHRLGDGGSGPQLLLPEISAATLFRCLPPGTTDRTGEGVSCGKRHTRMDILRLFAVGLKLTTRGTYHTAGCRSDRWPTDPAQLPADAGSMQQAAIA